MSKNTNNNNDNTIHSDSDNINSKSSKSSKNDSSKSSKNDSSKSSKSSKSNDSSKSNGISKSISNDSSITSKDSAKDTYSPIDRYIKSLEISDIPQTVPIQRQEKQEYKVQQPKIQDTGKKDIKKIKSASKPESKNKSISKGVGKENLYTPPYDSFWFKTENGLSLEMYLKRLFVIARDNLGCNLAKDTTKAILVPHASISSSGICSASAYYELHNHTTKITRIILLCTNHQVIGGDSKSNAINIIGTTYSKIASYKNKGGKSKLSIDTKTMEKLRPFIRINNELFENEHSFYNQLPFIETIAADALVCPLLIGNMIFTPENNTKIREILNILKKLLDKEGTVLVCTSDLSHINGDFQHKINNYISQNIRKSDSEILQFLYNMVDGIKSRMSKIDEMLFLQNSPSCGIFAMYIFGKLLNLFTKMQSGLVSTSSSDSNNSSSSLTINVEYKKYFYSRVSCYYTSLGRDYIDVFNFNKNQLVHFLDITNTSQSSVSYAGVVFTTQGNIQTRKVRKIEHICSEYEKIALTGISREQLYHKLSSKYGLLTNGRITNNSGSGGIKIPDALIKPIASPVFKLNLGVFVTLYKNDELRGCIGTLETDNDEANIESNVKKYVLEAAIKDSRFKPVELTDFNQLEFNITILYTMKPITLNEYFGSRFVLGRDGLLLSQGNKQGYFLPSVATEFKYDKQRLLEELCINKMGYNTKECFRNMNTKLFYNEGIDFSTK
jgi:hypothetical protein